MLNVLGLTRPARAGLELMTSRVLSESTTTKLPVGWLFTVLRPAQEFFTYMETSTLPVNRKTVYKQLKCREFQLDRVNSKVYIV
jgi:hypothetical protein